MKAARQTGLEMKDLRDLKYLTLHRLGLEVTRGDETGAITATTQDVLSTPLERVVT
jgi:hypothetical protein